MCSGCIPPAQDEFEALWGEEVAETEDDVLSLAVSFLVVQADKTSGGCSFPLHVARFCAF